MKDIRKYVEEKDRDQRRRRNMQKYAEKQAEREKIKQKRLEESKVIREQEKERERKDAFEKFQTTMFAFWETMDSAFYFAGRELLIHSVFYYPNTDIVAELYKGIDAGLEVEVDLKPWHVSLINYNLLFSPRAHKEVATMTTNYDISIAKKFEQLATVCCEAILSTGDGTEEHPYKVIRYSDEKDLIDYLGKKIYSEYVLLDAIGMKSPNEDGKNIDIIICVDGTKICFDITPAKQREEEKTFLHPDVKIPEISSELNSKIHKLAKSVYGPFFE